MGRRPCECTLDSRAQSRVGVAEHTVLVVVGVVVTQALFVGVHFSRTFIHIFFLIVLPHNKSRCFSSGWCKIDFFDASSSFWHRRRLSRRFVKSPSFRKNKLFVPHIVEGAAGEEPRGIEKREHIIIIIAEMRNDASPSSASTSSSSRDDERRASSFTSSSSSSSRRETTPSSRSSSRGGSRSSVIAARCSHHHHRVLVAATASAFLLLGKGAHCADDANNENNSNAKEALTDATFKDAIEQCMRTNPVDNVHAIAEIRRRCRLGM